MYPKLSKESVSPWQYFLWPRQCKQKEEQKKRRLEARGWKKSAESEKKKNGEATGQRAGRSSRPRNEFNDRSRTWKEEPAGGMPSVARWLRAVPKTAVQPRRKVCVSSTARQPRPVHPCPPIFIRGCNIWPRLLETRPATFVPTSSARMGA